MHDVLDRLLDVNDMAALAHPEALLYFVATLVLIAIAKLGYDRTVAYSLVTEIADRDNKAAGISFSGFLFGFGLILWGVLSGGTRHPGLWADLADMAIAGATGMVLLAIGQWVAERAILPRWRIRDEIAERNLAAGIAEGASYVGTGLIVMACVGSDVDSLAARLVTTAIFFALGQLAFVLFSLAYQFVTPFDVANQIHEGNTAAALGLGGNLIAIGILLSHAIQVSPSLLAFGAWWIGSAVLLTLFRFVVDHIILPGHSLNDEIARDKNWGIALLEAVSTAAIALIVTSAL